MRSSAPYFFCRLCGTRYRSDKVYQHERTCSQLSKSSSIFGETKEFGSNVYLKEIPSSKSVEKDSDGKISLSQSNTENQTFEEKEHEQNHSSISESEEPNPEVVSKEKDETLKDAYPKSSSQLNLHQGPFRNNSAFLKPKSSEVPGENPKQAWNANANVKLSAKSPEPKPTKKYKHYPVSCEFCNEKMQPGPLRKHIQKYHTKIDLSPQTEELEEITDSEKKKSMKPSKKSGSRFKICYICGRQFGSKSLPIHEPKCLEKWHIQNNQLPENKRMPEPVRPETITERASSSKENLPGAEDYSDQLPEFNAENEAAYQSHLKNLVPCSFCGRKFNPDRIMVHEGACIKKPKKRTYQTPEKDKN